MTGILDSMAQCTARVGIIGQRCTGQPLARVLAGAGRRARGVGVAPCTVAASTRAGVDIVHIGSAGATHAEGRGCCSVTSELPGLAECDAMPKWPADAVWPAPQSAPSVRSASSRRLSRRSGPLRSIVESAAVADTRNIIQASADRPRPFVRA